MNAPTQTAVAPAGTVVAPPVEEMWATLSDPGADARRFAQSWLALQCGMLPGARHGFVLLQHSTAAPPLVLSWPEGQQPAVEITRMAERAAREGKGAIAWTRTRMPAPAATQGLDLLAAHPIGPDAAPVGAIVVQLSLPKGIEGADPDGVLRQLRWGTGWLQSLAGRQNVADAASVIERASLGMDLVAAAGEQATLRQSAMVVVNDLAQRLRCDRVALGVVRRGGVTVKAISHAASFQANSHVVDALENAMEECLFQRAAVAYPPVPDTERRIAIAHRDLSAAAAARAVVASVILPGPGGTPVGVITLERHTDQPFDPATLKLAEAAATLVGTVFHYQIVQERWIAGRALTLLGQGLRAIVGPRRPALKLAVAAGIAAIVALFIVPGDFRVTARTVLEGQVQRAAVAPYDGFVSKAPVRPGDHVRVGDILAALDDRDLVLERARAKADLERYAQKYREALAKHDRPEIVMTAAQMQQAQAQLALTEEKLSRSQIVAPIDGIIVRGDLTQLLGAPVEKGKVLFEIAPVGDFRLALQVDDRDIGHVQAGQDGMLMLTGMPLRRFPFTVSRVTPIATAEDGRNFFRVEARLPAEHERDMRPGMEGIAKIHAGTRSLAWIWSHDVIEWVRLALWRWLP